MHGNVRYHCCNCETQFTYETNMKRHAKKQHGGRCVTAQTVLIQAKSVIYVDLCAISIVSLIDHVSYVGGWTWSAVSRVL